MSAIVWFRVKSWRRSRTTGVLVHTLACLLASASAIAAQAKPVPVQPAPPESTTQRRPRALQRLNATQLAAIASRFSASEFRAQVLKFPKIVQGPVVTLPRTRQAQPPSQINNIPTVTPKQMQSPSQTKNIPTITPQQTQSPLQLSKIPEAQDEGVKLTLIPETAAKLLEGCDPGYSPSWPPDSSAVCPTFTTSMYTPTSTDTLFPGRTVAVTRFSRGGAGRWSVGALDVFSFKKLAPGFWVSGYRLEALDLKQALLPLCTAQMKGRGFPEVWNQYVQFQNYSNPLWEPGAAWDYTTQTLSVHVPSWSCFGGVVDPNANVAWAFASYVEGTSAAEYALTVWVTGPKDKSPWGGKIIRVP